MNYGQRVDEIVGWAGDGEALCTDCVGHAWIKANDAEPIFAGAEVDADLTCDGCFAVIIEAPEPEPTPRQNELINEVAAIEDAEWDNEPEELRDSDSPAVCNRVQERAVQAASEQLREIGFKGSFDGLLDLCKRDAIPLAEGIDFIIRHNWET